MKKKILISLFFVLSLIGLFGCNEKPKPPTEGEINYYKLTLSSHITSNVEDETKIKEGTKVTLTVQVPEGKRISVFSIFGIDELENLVENKYTFTMVRDTEVSVTFKDIEATEPKDPTPTPPDPTPISKPDPTPTPPEPTPPEPTPTPAQEELYAVYINYDGFPQHYYDQASLRGKIPNLEQFTNEGTSFTNLETIFPSYTNPVQAAIISGTSTQNTMNVGIYFDKTTNKVIDQARTNHAQTFYQAAVAAGLSVVNVRHYPGEADLTKNNPNALYVTIDDGIANGVNRLEQAIKIVKGETFTSYGNTFTISEVPRLLTVYTDDLDGIGHNYADTYQYKRSNSDEAVLDTAIDALADFDVKLGELVQAYKDRGIYDRTVFVLTTDHGMTPFGALTTGILDFTYASSKLSTLISKIESLDPSYKVEFLEPGESPKPETTIVLTGKNLSTQVTFLNKTSITEIMQVQDALATEEYIGLVQNRNELIAQGVWRGANIDLLVSASGRYHLSPTNTLYKVRGTHDTYQDTSKKVFGVVFGGAVKNQIIDERVENISLGVVVAQALRLTLTNQTAAILDVLKEEYK